ncbi:probable RNA-binding protein 18 [Nilaparvata lugens]|uniref:probable RNA-binding protein 18 n=1 Tax=Nilaparvata lugens TaxID=108931 RepID=UPI00193DE887|nr:probable RNA-binding protein 18 [Nilaparvata lugens]
MPLTKTVEVPPEPIEEVKDGDQRLWIGNLDNRITEYYLLKLLQKYGAIEKFDMLFHRSGPLSGQSRGYAFVTYESRDIAEQVKNYLDGKRLGTKHVAVRWAHNMTKEDCKKTTELLQISALTGAKSSEKKISRSTTIQAIEAKLKTMEHTPNEFELTGPSTSVPNNSSFISRNNHNLSSAPRSNHNSSSVPRSNHYSSSVSRSNSRMPVDRSKNFIKKKYSPL